MKKLVTFIFSLFLSLIAFSQVVENVDFNLIDNKIVIYYDLLDCDNKYSYEVDIRFVDDRGNTIIPRNLTGDYGKITCGRNKKVEWDLFKEVNQFEGNYKAIVTIASIQNKLGRTIAAKPGNNTILLSPVIIYAPFGIKYHYSKLFGAYASFNSDLGLSEFSVMFTTGFSFQLARTIDIYLGFGYGYDQWGDTYIFEGGMLKKNKNKLSYDIGILVLGKDYDNLWPGIRLGIGYNF